MDDWYNDDWQGAGIQRPAAVPSNPVNPQPLPLYIKGENINPVYGSTEDNEFPVYGGDEEDPELMRKLVEDFQRGDDALNNSNVMGTEGTSPDTGSITPRSALSAPGDFNTNFDMLNSNNKNIGFNAMTDSANLTNSLTQNNMLNSNGPAALNKALDTEIGTPKVQNLSNTTAEDDDSDTTSDPVAAKMPYTVTNKAKYQAKLDENKKRIEELEQEISEIEFTYSTFHPELDKELQDLYNQNGCIGQWIEDGEASGGLAKTYVQKDMLKTINYSDDTINDSFMHGLCDTINKFILKGCTSEAQAKKRIAMFLAQISVESKYGRDTVEDVNIDYANSRYGPPGTKDSYMGDLVDPKTGLRRYCGGGYIQLSTRGNYAAFAKDMNDPEILNQGVYYVAKYYPWQSAGWWWEQNNMNSLIDRGASIKDISYTVNGGDHGLDERISAYNTIIAYLNRMG